MKLKTVMDNLDEVDSSFHSLYTEKNGKFVLTGIEGVKTQEDIDSVTRALNNEKAAHKKTKEKFSVLGDRDIEEVVSLLDKIPELEAAAKGGNDQEKINELVEAKIRTKLAPLERERDQLKKRIEESENVIAQFNAKERQRSIHDAVRSAATSAKVLPEALEDALMLAERVFDVDESGSVVTRDSVGVTPGIDPAVWLTEIQQKRPHWWAPSQGGGSRGSNVNGAGGAMNPWSKEGWNMTEQGKVYRENPQRAEQLAKSAGTSIGGPRPI